MKFVTVDVDDTGTVKRTLTEPAKKRLMNALAVLNAIAAATAGIEDSIECRDQFALLAKEWGCDVPTNLLPQTTGTGQELPDSTGLWRRNEDQGTETIGTSSRGSLVCADRGGAPLDVLARGGWTKEPAPTKPTDGERKAG